MGTFREVNAFLSNPRRAKFLYSIPVLAAVSAILIGHSILIVMVALDLGAFIALFGVGFYVVRRNNQS